MIFFLDQVSEEAVTKVVDLFVAKLQGHRLLSKSAFKFASKVRNRILLKKRAVV